MPFTRKLNVPSAVGGKSLLDQAGLLARVVADHLPSRLRRTSGFHSAGKLERMFIACLPHSYGDSAGFAPDFPFNLDFLGRGPNRCKCREQGVEDFKIFLTQTCLLCLRVVTAKQGRQAGTQRILVIIKLLVFTTVHLCSTRTHEAILKNSRYLFNSDTIQHSLLA